MRRHRIPLKTRCIALLLAAGSSPSPATELNHYNDLIGSHTFSAPRNSLTYTTIHSIKGPRLGHLRYPDSVDGETSPDAKTERKYTKNSIDISRLSAKPVLAIEERTDIKFTAQHELTRHSETAAAIDPQPCGPSPLTAEEVANLVIENADRQGVEQKFALAIAYVESGFDRRRNSPKGARGPMQLMPETAARFGVLDVCDAQQNIAAGLKYLRTLQNEFQNPLLVAAAYNAGEDRIHEYGGVPPFSETVNYVAKIVNYQLGLPSPSRSNAKASSSSPSSRTDVSGDEVGVIGIHKDGKFTGGVMHF